MLLAVLGGCGLVRDDIATTVVARPGKFAFYDCPLLGQTLTRTRARIAEYERMTARAAQSPGGAAIANLSYRAEYLSARGDETELVAALKEKNCQAESAWTSERVVY